MDTNTATYTIDFWGSEPCTNDDCWMGEDFADREVAEKTYREYCRKMERGESVDSYVDGCTAYIVLAGPDVYEEHKVSTFRPDRGMDDGWSREFAMQNGMAFGCDGYNDAMGY